MPAPALPSRRPRLSAALRVAADGRPGGADRIELLAAIEHCGSITAAARALGLSYRTAWDAVQALHGGSAPALVERAAGGRGGGSTRLTDAGRALLRRWELVQAVHQRFVARLDAGAMDLSRPFSWLEVMNVRTSARNQWPGRVLAVRPGAVNDELLLALDGPPAGAGAGTATLRAVVTSASRQALGLAPGAAVLALVKASGVTLQAGAAAAGTPGPPDDAPAANRLEGVVRAVQAGPLDAEVVLDLPGGLTLAAVLPVTALQALDLAPGRPAVARVQASDVLLAVVD